MFDVKSAALETLGELRPAQLDARHIREPLLLFADGRRVPDPKTGLALYGPFDLHAAEHRQTVRIGMIGTGAMLDLAGHWIERCSREVPAVRKRKVKGQLLFHPLDPMAHPEFPGLEHVFHTTFVTSSALTETLTERDVAQIQALEVFEDRVTRLVDVLVERLRVLADKSAVPDVVVVALPSELRKTCTVPSKHRRRNRGYKTLAQALALDLARDAEQGQGNLFDIAAAQGVDLDTKEEAQHVVLHHALKARAMEIGLPTQLTWQTNLEGGATVEDDATRAWKFWTGMYYKAGGVPWRVAGLPRGTCYVGLSFYKDRTSESLRTCMAQAFSDLGEGIVLRSEPFRWTYTRNPHLPPELARHLISRVLAAYEAHARQKPSRVVVHKWQRYWDEELAAFQSVLNEEVPSHDLVTFGSRGIRFFRAGAEPPLRGTLINLAPGNAILYTRGYVPYLEQYSGMRVPRPLEIVEHYGSAALSQIASEIMALTKMDHNSATFAGKASITTAFSEDVGKILSELPDGVEPRPQYRFYM